jgi:hypothetical protein
MNRQNHRRELLYSRKIVGRIQVRPASGNSPGDSLEDIDLPYDDGATFDDEAAFVAAAETACVAAPGIAAPTSSAVTETR